MLPQRQAKGGSSSVRRQATHQPRNRSFQLLMICACVALLFADQNLLSPNMTAAGKDLGMETEKERYRKLGSWIMFGFFTVGGPSALLAGYLTSMCNRVVMLSVMMVLGEAPCLLTAFVTDYWQLLLLRLLTGISVGGTLPLAMSILSDIYSSSERVQVSAAVQIAGGLGIGLGQVTAGTVGPALGWRLPFVLVAVPALLMAMLVLCCIKEPSRGAMESFGGPQGCRNTPPLLAKAADEEAAGPAKPPPLQTCQKLRDRGEEGGLAAAAAVGPSVAEATSFAKFGALLAVPTNACLILQGLAGCLPIGLVNTFLNDFLAQKQGLSVQAATGIMVLWGIGSAVGVVAGGAVLGQWLHNNWLPWQPVLMAAGSALAAPCVLWLINGHVAGRWLAPALCSAFLGGLSSGVAGPNIRGLMLSVNVPEMRGMAIAMQTLVDDIGRAFGPLVIGILISFMSPRTAFTVVVLAWLPSAALILASSWTVCEDVEQVRSVVLKRAAGAPSNALELSPRQAPKGFAGMAAPPLAAASADGADPDEESSLLSHCHRQGSSRAASPSSSGSLELLVSPRADATAQTLRTWGEAGS